MPSPQAGSHVIDTGAQSQTILYSVSPVILNESATEGVSRPLTTLRNDLGISTISPATFSLDPARTQRVDSDLVSRSSHIFASLEIEIVLNPIAALVYFRGDVLGAHADGLLRGNTRYGSG